MAIDLGVVILLYFGLTLAILGIAGLAGFFLLRLAAARVRALRHPGRREAACAPSTGRTVGVPA